MAHPVTPSPANQRPFPIERRAKRRRQSDPDLPFSSEILDQMPDALIITDLEGRIVRWIGRAEEMFGYSAQEAVGRDLGFLHRRGAEATCGAALVEETLEKGEFFGESVGVRKDGSEVPVETSAKIIRATDGRPLFVIAIHRDVTERRRAAFELARSEEALRRQGGIFQSVLENLGDGVAVADRAGNFVLFNRAAERILGRRPEAYSGPDQFGLYLPDRKTAFPIEDSPLARALRGEEVDDVEAFLRRPEEEEGRWICTSARPTRGQDGGVQAAVCVFRDVTKQKRAEEELRRQKEFTDSVIQSSVDGILAFDRECRYTVWNRAMEQMTGFPAPAVLGRRAAEVFPFLVETGELRFLEAALSGERIAAMDRPYDTGPGHEGFFDGHYAPLYDDAGEIAGGLGVIRETTRRKRLEGQLRESQKLESLGTLAGGIAHDFNNILNIISAYGGLIARQDGANPSVIGHLEAIQRTVERGAGVVRQLLTVARKGDILFVPVSLNAIVEELARLLRETFPKSLEISVDLEADLPAVSGDANQVLQALLNLCLNARDAMPSGGKMTLRTQIHAGEDVRKRLPSAGREQYACVSVADTGTGMDATTRSRVFEPFFTTKEHGSGTGLGLAVVYGIAESHGGHIEVETKLGAGSTFRLYFPVENRTEAEKTGPAVRRGRRTDGVGRTILLVEDEPLLLDSVRLLLEEEGYHVLPAADGIEALELFSANRGSIDLVVADAGLPRLGGWEAFRRMKAIDPGLAAILVSGILGPETRAQYAAGGVLRTLLKPYSADDILRCVGEVLDDR